MVFKCQIVHGLRRGEIVLRDLPSYQQVMVHTRPEGVGDEEYYTPIYVPAELKDVKVNETFDVCATQEVFRLIEVQS